MGKNFFGIIILAALCGALYWVFTMKTTPKGSVCYIGSALYTPLCNNIGKSGHILSKAGYKISYGKVVGVSWRPRGTSLDKNGSKRKISDRDEYYYMLSRNDGKTWTMERSSLIRLE
jgi:hypothetical protein